MNYTSQKSIDLTKQICDLANNFKSDKEISKILDLPVYTISNRRNKAKIKSGNTQLRNYYKTSIVKLHSEGKNISQISKILNIPDSTCAQYCKELNLNPIWTKRSYFTTSDRIKGYMIRNVKFSAKRRNLDFNLEYQDIQLPVICPILEIPLLYKGNFQDPCYATIDRIDNSKGYIKGNVIVISRLANSMKNSASFNQIETFCKNISKLINNHGALGSITDIFPNIKLLET